MDTSEPAGGLPKKAPDTRVLMEFAQGTFKDTFLKADLPWQGCGC